MEIFKWNLRFRNFTQINVKLSSILKWVKLKWAKLKSVFVKSILEISQMDAFDFWTQFDPKESFEVLEGL